MTPVFSAVKDFKAWLAAAEPGACCCYGQHQICTASGGRLAIAEEAWDAYAAGLVVLVQKRVSGCLMYLAQRRDVPASKSRRAA